MKKYLPVLVYAVGMFPLGLWQDRLRVALGDWPALVVVIGYLLLLRLVGLLVVRAVEQSHKVEIRKHNLAIEKRKQKNGV